MQNTIIVGYGNADRQDDGVAWHVLVGLNRLLGRQAPSEPEDGFELVGSNPEFFYSLQLTPDMVDMVANFKRVCFVDAHTGDIPQELQIVSLQAGYQSSPFTHHMTPETLLWFTQTLHGQVPEAILVSIHGYQFGFNRQLSPITQSLAEEAIHQIWSWLTRE